MNGYDHTDTSTELIRAFFAWADKHDLRPTVQAIRRTDQHGPRFRIAVDPIDGQRASLTFDDIETAEKVAEFTRAVRLFHPRVPAFGADDAPVVRQEVMW